MKYYENVIYLYRLLIHLTEKEVGYVVGNYLKPAL